jgi:hypothetical protein
MMRIRCSLSAFFILLLLNHKAHSAVAIDTKFVARILGASDSKKTILVNRGSEHGLAKMQHAKISIPSGVIARAVIVKISPSRSVWSVYRVFKKNKIEPQAVATFKISSPVSLTTDESKELGRLGPKINKTREAIPKDPKFVKKQRKINRSIKMSENVVSQFDNIDYSDLNEAIETQQELDVDLDWSALNGKKDQNNFDATLDYSQLR